ncbi:MAG: hypothetical protein QW502_02025 [Candidatus Bathyarchaeia archaeon]|nr:hypothetical protein [Candidatus Bathyarchaeota archaeon]
MRACMRNIGALILGLTLMLSIGLAGWTQASVWNSLYAHASPIRAEEPKIRLREGTAGTSIISINGTSAKVSISSDIIAYNPSGYTPLGGTTLISGALNDIRADDSVYMTFRSCGYSAYNESLDISSTTSISYVDKVSLTFNPPETGHYIIIADAEIQCSSTAVNAGVKARLYNGTNTYQEVIYRPRNTAEWYPFNALKQLYIQGQTTIRLQFASVSGSSVSIRNARLFIFKATSVHYAESEGRSTTNSTLWVDKVTLRFTPSSEGDYLIIATANLDSSSTSYDVMCRLIQDDSIIHAEVRRRPRAASNRYNFGAMRKITLDLSEHIFSLQFCSSSSFATAGIQYAHIIVISLRDFPAYYYQESESESAAQQPNTWYDKVTLSYVPLEGEHLIIGSLHHTSGSPIQQVQFRLSQNGNIASDRVVRQGASMDYEASFSFMKVMLNPSIKTDKIQFSGTSKTVRVKMARLVSIQLPFQQIAEMEFTGTSNIKRWAQLTWTVDCSASITSTTVVIQLYNYQIGGYPEEGNGFAKAEVGLNDSTIIQTIRDNPACFRDASGRWRMRIRCLKTRTDPFDFRIDWIEFKVFCQNTYDYVLKITNCIADSWIVRFRAYSEVNIGRLYNYTIYVYDGDSSIQIQIIDGDYSQQCGSWLSLDGFGVIYVVVSVSALELGISRIHTYLEINRPNTSVYNLMDVEFEVS